MHASTHNTLLLMDAVTLSLTAVLLFLPPVSSLQGDRGLQGERGNKGVKGSMGDSGVPGESVSFLNIHCFTKIAVL